jgi:hypothetical protein
VKRRELIATAAIRAVLIAVVLVAVAFISAGCTGRRELRAVIQDASGRPIPGAVFYAEAYTNSGAFDFAFSSAGPSGEVPPAAGRPLSIEWAPGAKLALAAFAPGKQPMVVYDQLGRVKADGLVIPLQDLPATGLRWEPRVANLSFPFEDNPKLAARITDQKCAPLRKAFREAYALLGREGLPRELTKLRFLEDLDRRR